MDFTPSQLNSILCRGRSVLVSAGAGSGKTRVLTERLMEYIDPRDPNTVPASIDRFVVITFTRAAAGELRGRIASAITERLRRTPDNMHLRRQLLLSRNAKIGSMPDMRGFPHRSKSSKKNVPSAFGPQHWNAFWSDITKKEAMPFFPWPRQSVLGRMTVGLPNSC